MAQKQVGEIENAEHISAADGENINAKRAGLYGYDYGSSQWRRLGISPDGSSDLPYAVKVTVSGSITYVALAAPGSAEASAVWQAKKVDETTGTVITWADGNSSFDNVATDLTALTYS